MAGATLRMTRARSEVLAELRRAHGHPTAIELYEAVRKTLPGVSVATVYRALDALAREGCVKALEAASGPRRYDAATAEHYHVVCERCGRLDDVSLKLREPLAGALVDARGYTVLGHTLCFRGLCPACQKKAGTKATRSERRKA